MNTMPKSKKIRVLVVDDSAVVRKVLTKELGQLGDIDVIGGAIDPYVARDKIIQLKPDVITLDIEMPRMDGLSFLAKLMEHYPLPVVLVSSLAPANSTTALKALELGAVEVVPKPTSRFSTPDLHRLARAIRAAAAARVRPIRPSSGSGKKLRQHAFARIETTHKILAIGASTGGTRAIESVLRELPADTPGTVIVQHMPAGFTASFAERLDRLCRMRVREARGGEAVVPGLVLIAPGESHMILTRSGIQYQVALRGGPAVHHQKPAVDVLFRSVAEEAHRNALGVILTGMGADGAQGLLEMKERGAATLAQDEESSVVFGMPREAIRMGAADQVVSLEQVPQAILDTFKGDAPAQSDRRAVNA